MIDRCACCTYICGETPNRVLHLFPQKAAAGDVLLSPRPVDVQIALAERPKNGAQAGSRDAFDLAEHTKTFTLPRPHHNGESLSFSVVGACVPAVLHAMLPAFLALRHWRPICYLKDDS